MLTHRTNVLLSPEEHQTLVALAKKHRTTQGGAIRLLIRKNAISTSKKTDRFDTIKNGWKLLKNPQIPINYKDLINHGRHEF